MPKYHVHRSIEIDAPADRVFQVVADFGTWASWSPWLCCEPTARVMVSENSNSVGSTYAWEGEIVGAGELEHLKLDQETRIEDEIRFSKPFKAISKVAFELEAVSGGTRLTWHMHGSMPLLLFWLIPKMKTFIGMDYERGLKMLKEWIETGDIQSQTIVKDVVPIGPLQVIGIRKTCRFDSISSAMEQAFTEASEALPQLDFLHIETAISVYHKMDFKQKTFDFTSGFVVSETTGELPAGLSTCTIPQIRALTAQHIGRYEHLGNAWSALMQHTRSRKLKQSNVSCFEIYKNDSLSTPPGELVTEIYVPIR